MKLRKSARFCCFVCVFAIAVWLLVTTLYLTPCNDGINETLQLQNRCPTVTIATVCLGTQSARHFSVMLKSLLLHSTSRIVYYVLTDAFTQKLLETTFELWPLDTVELRYINAKDYLEAMKDIPTKHYAKENALLKLALVKALPINVSQVLVLDADLLVLADLHELFTSSDKMLTLVENLSNYYIEEGPKQKPWPALCRGFNTGVMRWNLDKMRASNFTKMWQSIAKANTQHYGPAPLADQDIINALITKYPEIVDRAHCAWNLQLGHKARPELCDSSQQQIKIVHWNSREKEFLRPLDAIAVYFSDVYKDISGMEIELIAQLSHNSRCVDRSSRRVETDSHRQREARNDACIDIRRVPLLQMRLQPYLWPFDYSTNGANQKDITLTTQLSRERLGQLPLLASAWRGPMSIAVYGRDGDVEVLVQLYRRENALNTRKNIALHLLIEKGDFYPVNTLRNIALHYASTDLTLIIDVDLIPSFNLYEMLNADFDNDWFRRRALIVPSFEVGHFIDTVGELPQSKTQLLDLLHSREAWPFRTKQWPQGQRATNYSHWIVAEAYYTVPYEQDFEPYLVIDKRFAPDFDERFVGFGWNKAQYAMHLDALGYDFVVLPNAWLMHVPHRKSIDMRRYTNNALYRKCMQLLKAEFAKELIKQQRLWNPLQSTPLKNATRALGVL